MPKEDLRKIKQITENDLDTGKNLVTENYQLEILSLKDLVDLRRFSRAFIKVDKLLKAFFNSLGEHINTKVTQIKDGHMSKEDKIKIDGIESNANNYKLPKASSSILGGIKIGKNLSIDPDGIVSGVDQYTHPTSSGNKHIPSGGGSNNFLKWSSDGIAIWSLIDWSNIQSKPSSYPPTSHTHDERYYTESEVNSLLNNKLGTTQKASDSSRLNGATESTGATANTIVKRDSAGDITARLMRSTYGDEDRMTGAVAFRVNTSDNYMRFCNSPSAFRNWLGANYRGKADLLWSGGHYMDGRATLSLSGKNFDQYQMIVIYVSCENGDWAGDFHSVQLVCPTAQYGNPSYDWKDLVGSDWCGAYLINNYQIKPYGGSAVYIRRVVGIR